MKIPSLFSFIKNYAHLSIGMIVGVFMIGTGYAMVTIPPACSTPGDCDVISPGFEDATLEGDLVLTDADASHTVSLSAAATILANLVFNLPAADGTAGQTLKTDGSGNLSFSQTSKRVGEMIFAKTDASKTVANGYLAVTPGTIANGATDYPVWAAMYPEFVAGADIVFPANVNGIFLRNAGGEAGAEGTFQNDAFESHNHSYVDRYRGTNISDDANDRNVADDNLTSGNYTTGNTGGSETRPKNYTYQLYTIVDTY